MICAGDELGLNDDHSGVLILPGDFQIGQPLDALIDISITPNRGDCLSLIGLARDIAGYFNTRVSLPTVRVLETMDRIENYLKVTVQNRQGCPRYGARYIRGVRVGPSPAWMTYRLESAGVRPLNNIIDATNYVMLEYGHPIHAFDLDRVANRHIIIRSAKDGEILETLDKEKIELTSEDLLITDPREPIALAGVMGGWNSGISPSTINVVLECAYFDPITIRKTSSRLGKQTEASFRFERDVDHEGIPRVLDRVASLIQNLAGGEIVHGMIDVKSYRSATKYISLSVERTNKVLGTQLGPRDIADLLVALNFEVTASNTEKITFAVPSFRNDITREVDLIEEVARMYGYEKIKPTLPYLPSAPTPPDPLPRLTRDLKKTLSALGFDEAINYSFTSSKLTELMGLPLDRAVKLTNPISAEQDIMRTSLLPGFIECVAHNLNRDVSDIRLYETGKIYRSTKNGTEEEVHLIAGLCGHKPSTWKQTGDRLDFYDVKGAAQAMLSSLGFCDMNLEPLSEKSYYHPKRSARLIRGDLELCRFGEVHPVLAERLELKERVYLLEMNLTRLAPHVKRISRFTPIPRFPSITRDLALILDEAVKAQDVVDAIKSTGGKDLESLTLFDLYRGDPVPGGKKSLAYSLTFRSPDRTLTDEEANRHMEEILSTLKKEFNATLR